MDEIKITRTEGDWTFGSYGPYRFQVKRTAEPTEFGLDFDGGRGRIIKLWVARGFTTVCSFDRGWDVLPSLDADMDCCADIIFAFN